MTSPEAIVRLRNVVKTYPAARGELAVLDDVSLDIDPGEFVMVTGPSGSGKTTFLNLVGLLDRPTQGEVRLLGQPVSAMPEPALREFRKRNLGMVFQQFHLLRHRTVRDNVRFRFRYLPVSRAEREAGVDRALERVGLAALADEPVRSLSGGELQRVAIARAVAYPPALLLADEPTGNLDLATADSILTLFADLNRDGITVIMVTHNEGLLRFARRQVVCRDGRLAEVAP